MSLIKFLLYRNNKTSVLSARKYGVKQHAEPKETSVLASRQYGNCVSQNKCKKTKEQELIK